MKKFLVSVIGLIALIALLCWTAMAAFAPNGGGGGGPTPTPGPPAVTPTPVSGTPPVFVSNGFVSLMGPVDNVLMGLGTGSAFFFVPDCHGANQALNYTGGSGGWSCQTIGQAAGALQAANNLADVQDAATAAANLNVPQLDATGVVFNDVEATSVNGALNPMSKQLLISRSSPPAYLPGRAACDGATDDYTALQNAILAGEGFADITQTNSSSANQGEKVEIPMTGLCCLHSKPLRITYDLELAGNNDKAIPQSSLCQNYDGVTLVNERYSLHPLQTLSEPSLPGSWLSIADAVDGGEPYITLTDFLNTPNFTQDGVNVYDVEGVDQRDNLGIAFDQPNKFFGGSVNAPGNAGSPAVMVQIDYATTPPKVKAFIKTSGSGVVTIAGPDYVAGTPVHWHAQKDGNTCHFWVNAPGTGSTDYGPATCNGTLVETKWEQINEPEDENAGRAWPDGGTFSNSVVNGGQGANAYIRVSNTARADTGFPSADPAVDINTILLCDWSDLNDPDGTQVCYNGTKKNGLTDNIYFAIKGVNGGNGGNTLQLARVHVHDLDLNNFANIVAPPGGYVSDGIYTSWGYEQEYDKLNDSDCNAYGIYDNAYLTSIHDNVFSAGNNGVGCKSGLILANAAPIQTEKNAIGQGWVGITAYMAQYVSTSDFFGGSTISAIPFFSQGAQDTLITPNVDQESSAPNELAGLYWLEGQSGNVNFGPTHVIISPQNITTGVSIPYIEQDNDLGDPIDVYGGWFRAGAPSGPLIHIDGQIGKYIDHFYGPSWGALSPISNHPEQVQVISDLTPTSIAGTGAGPAFCTETIAGVGGAANCNLSGYAQSGSADTWTYPVPFNQKPNLIFSGCSAGTPTTSATVLTLPQGTGNLTCTITIAG